MRVLLLAGAAILLAAAPAAAHFMPGDRTIIIQAEPRSVALLVSYKPPSGVVGDLLAAEGALGRPQDRVEYTRAIYARRALAPIKLSIDGVELKMTDMQVKLVEDPPRSHRHTVVVLVSGEIPAGAHNVSVDVAASAEPTSTEWIDHSEGNVVEFGPRPAGRWLRDRARLELAWAKEAVR